MLPTENYNLAAKIYNNHCAAQAIERVDQKKYVETTFSFNSIMVLQMMKTEARVGCVH